MSSSQGLVNVRELGAGNGDVAVDTAAFNAALESGAAIVPPGDYVCRNIVCNRSRVEMVGYGKPTITAAPGTTGNLFLFSGDDVTLRGLELRGPEYSAYGDNISLDTLVRVQKPSYALVNDFKVVSCRFVGGRKSLVVTTANRVSLHDIDVERPYERGIVVQGGQKSLRIDGARIKGVGLYEGIKLGYGDQNIPYEDILMTNFVIEDCGRLNPVMGNWQEGIDLFAESIRYVKIANGIIRRCGNGGIELKKGPMLSLPDVYEKIMIDGLLVEIDADRGAGVTIINKSGASSPPDNTRHISINRLDVFYTGGGRAVYALGAAVTGASDVEIGNSTFADLQQGIRLVGTGAPDNTIHRPRVTGVKTRNVLQGVYFAGDNLDGLVVEHSDIEANHNCVYSQRGTGSIRHNRLRSMTAAAVRWDAGYVEVTDNDVAVPDNRKTVDLSAGTATCSASGNNRGPVTGRPASMTGSVGDEFRNSAPTPGSYTKWIMTAGGLWKGAGLVEE